MPVDLCVSFATLFPGYINFYKNNFRGQMPDRLLKPNTLIYVDLSFNALTGTLPVNAVSLNLRHLYLSHNQLSGDIPMPTSLLPLEDLFLDYNQLTKPSYVLVIPCSKHCKSKGMSFRTGLSIAHFASLTFSQDGVLVDLAADCAICSCSGRLCNACVLMNDWFCDY
jgi:Leucine-rich repeat (LRR) protein